jgi:hypothetical protein
MSGKSAEMGKFIAGLLVLTPIGLVSGVLALGWAWEWLAGCFFSLATYCGQGASFKAIIFGVIAAGCFTAIKSLWDKSK